jgi:hypothetical protein
MNASRNRVVSRLPQYVCCALVVDAKERERITADIVMSTLYLVARGVREHLKVILNIVKETAFPIVPESLYYPLPGCTWRMFQSTMLALGRPSGTRSPSYGSTFDSGRVWIILSEGDTQDGRSVRRSA